MNTQIFTNTKHRRKTLVLIGKNPKLEPLKL